MILRMGENEKKIDLVLIKKEHGRFIPIVKAIPWGVSTRISGSRYS